MIQRLGGQSDADETDLRHMVPAIPQRSDRADRVIMGAAPAGASRSERIRLYNVIAGSSQPIDEMRGQVIDLTGAVVSTTQWAGDNGELTEGYKVWLLTASGNGYFSGSTGVANSLLAIESFFGPPPWTPAVKVRMEEKKTANGRRYYYLSLIDTPEMTPPLPAKPAGKAK